MTARSCRGSKTSVDIASGPRPPDRYRGGRSSVCRGLGHAFQAVAVESVAERQIELTPSAHAKDVVTAILSDFRGLDTMGEITVIGITMVGLITLLQRPMTAGTRMTQRVTRLLFAPTLMVAFAVLVKG